MKSRVLSVQFEYTHRLRSIMSVGPKRPALGVARWLGAQT